MLSESLSLVAAARALREGTLTSEELTRACLERIRQEDGQLQAWVLVDEQSALEQARRCDQERRSGYDRGWLHGIPVGVKDIIDVAGWPTRLWRTFARCVTGPRGRFRSATPASGRCGHPGQNRYHAVRGVRSAAHPPSLVAGPHTRRFIERFRGSGCPRHVSGGVGDTDRRFHYPPGRLLRCGRPETYLWSD
jgi:hypothetical protein